jgi:hypothetical protein
MLQAAQAKEQSKLSLQTLASAATNWTTCVKGLNKVLLEVHYLQVQQDATVVDSDGAFNREGGAAVLVLGLTDAGMSHEMKCFRFDFRQCSQLHEVLVDEVGHDGTHHKALSMTEALHPDARRVADRCELIGDTCPAALAAEHDLEALATDDQSGDLFVDLPPVLDPEILSLHLLVAPDQGLVEVAGDMVDLLAENTILRKQPNNTTYDTCEMVIWKCQASIIHNNILMLAFRTIQTYTSITTKCTWAKWRAWGYHKYSTGILLELVDELQPDDHLHELDDGLGRGKQVAR